ncbi:hypothetical protein [Bradyrhizobium uaiense]|uniref:Uncharacterized protein n=1 Tax=Bradyrhizobium uaiense TaxID=2594946 RepID=A0A6P1BR74_9BRAD|nr:hypothetical protein [Bradyrhizobium uaiense]NEV00103.1 hypothetical protein [Bradyrhizobium uaiense]
MAQSLTIVAPEDVLEGIQAALPGDEILWSDREPMDSPLNPLDDPLGGIPIDYICHIVTIVLQTGTAGATFASAVVKLVNLLKKPVQVRDTKTNKLVITVKPGTTTKQLEDAIPSDPDAPA